MSEINRLKSAGEESFYTDFDSTQQIYLEILRIAQQENRVIEQLEAIYNLCFCADYHERMTEYQQYIRLGRQFMNDNAEKIKSADKKGIHRASMIQAFGMYSYALGAYDDAIGQFSKVLNLNGSMLTRDSSTITYIGAYLGQSWFNLGNIDKAYQFFEMTRAYIPRNSEDYTHNQAVYFMYEAECLIVERRYKEALYCVRQSLRLLKKENNPAATKNPLIANYKLAARIHLEQGDYASAEQMVANALRLHVADDINFPATYRFLADIYYKENKSDSALAYYHKSNIAFNRSFRSLHAEKAPALTGLANVYRDRNQFEKAAGYYRESLKNLFPEQHVRKTDPNYLNLADIALPDRAMQVLLEQGRLFFRWYQSVKNPSLLDSCTLALTKALQLNDRGRREMITMESKELRARLQAEITDLGAEASYMAFSLSNDQKYIATAFHFIEKGKANILLDKASEIRARGYAGIPDEVLLKETTIKGELSVYRTRFLKSRIVSDEKGNEEELYYNKLREYTMLISDLEEKYPRYYKLKYDNRTVNLEEIQHAMRKARSMLIEYYLGSNKVFILAISGNKVLLKAVKRDKGLDQHFTNLLQEITRTDVIENGTSTTLFRQFNQSASFVYSRLLGPVLSEIRPSVKHLTLIPDGMLCYLPFEILLTKLADTIHNDFGVLPYLMCQYEIRYGYSASLVVSPPAQTHKSSYPYVGFAPTFIRNPLSANREEINACRAIWNGLAFQGDYATESTFKSIAGKAAIIHLATHSVVNDSDSRQSFIAFTEQANAAEDGSLHTYELYDMSLAARLAILSGCETGIGNLHKGEGILSLARAFNYAGCSDIMMSLWKVNDRCTQDIMTAFCRYLKKGMPAERALRKAKLEYLKSSPLTHPVFWSSFVLIGFEQDKSRFRSIPPVLWIPSVLLIFIASYLLYRRVGKPGNLR